MHKKSFTIVFALFSFAALLFLFHVAWATTNISSSTGQYWGWNDSMGWLDFYDTNSVNVSSQGLSGYASSSVGDVSLDCHTTRNGPICTTSNYQVVNDGLGNLSGWGWNDTYGWISFCGGQGTSNCPGTASSYQVQIDPSTGNFLGNGTNYAWNDVAGWVSFNCANNAGCPQSSYKVVTTWIATSTSGYVDSTTYDTGVQAGAQLNSFIWYGTQPAGTSVRFQFAVSNASSDPWTFIGPDGTGQSYYTVGPNVPTKLDYTLFNNTRYFRYRVTLVSNQSQTVSPQVTKIIVNWSP